MTRAIEKICHEVAGRVLDLKRGLNTPETRLELAEEIQATIETFFAFEQRKTKRSMRRRK